MDALNEIHTAKNFDEKFDSIGYPVGYVLTNKITNDNLNCLQRKTLDESIARKLKVRVITMGGTTTNLPSMKMFV